jgi:DNA-binding response OmpR family regulator
VAREDAGAASLIEVLVSRIRRKLHRPQQLPLLHTIRGVGYQLGGTPEGVA